MDENINNAEAKIKKYEESILELTQDLVKKTEDNRKLVDKLNQDKRKSPNDIRNRHSVESQESALALEQDAEKKLR